MEHRLAQEEEQISQHVKGDEYIVSFIMEWSERRAT